LPAVTLTFFSQEPMTRGEAIEAIESLLALNGIALTPLGDRLIKAVPLSEITSQVPRVWQGSTLDAEANQIIYEKLFELDFLTTEEAIALLGPLLSQGAPIAFDKSSRILITDALVNLQRVERFLQIIDKPSALKSEMLFFELQNIRAEEVLRRLNEFVEGPLRRQLQGNTTFSADERTNQIIAFTHPSNVGLLQQLVARLDINVAPNTATKVFSIRYADATEVVTIIEQVVTGQREAQEQGSGTTTTNNRRTPRPQPQQPTTATRTGNENLQFSSFLTIVPDERANTIVASGTHSDLEYLGQLISEIDSLLAQVRIEVVITEVRLEDTDLSGLDSFGFTYNPASAASGFNVTTDSDVTSQWNGSGNFYGVPIRSTWGPNGFGIDFVLETAKTKSNVTVLSAPTIVTTHNKEATVAVGEERPVITGVVTQNNTGTTGLTTSEQVQFKDIKLELKVTPLIGSDGVVQMEIEQQIQSVVGEVTINSNSQPIVGTRTATSFVSVNDGDLIVLGGLQSLDKSDSENRMAILGSIPVLGDLFKSNNRRTTRNELLIFIRPTILRTTGDANRDAQRQINVIEGTEKIRDYLDRGTFRPKEQVIDPDSREIPRRNKP
jgi:general secretion pathway protein D